MSNWQMSRIQYGFSLGILVATWIHFPAPRALFAFGVASALTALRFRALGWKQSRAFLPFAIAVLGTALIMIVGQHSKASVTIAHVWRFAAIVTQSGMILRAILAYAPVDPISPKAALAQDFMAKRRRLRHSIKEGQPVREAHSREVKKLVAINEELKAYVAAHGHVNSEEHQAILARFEAQKAVLAPLSAETGIVNDRMTRETQELKDASQAWKNRNRPIAP